MIEKRVLLLGRDKSFLINTSETFHCQYGTLNIKKIKKFGQKVKIGKECFMVVKPTIIDLLKKCRRIPQVVLPKDAAQIIAITGVSHGWKCLDAGSGSGFLALFLGHLVQPDGKVITYERNKRFAENVKKNIELCGLEKTVKIKNKDILKGFPERSLDLVTLDMMHAEKIVPKAHKAMKPGAWIVVYSPHIEQQKRVIEEMKKLSFTQVKTLENIQREWLVNNYKSGYTHPKPSGILHTGFMTFARKV
jgi:tRNA (adenine57-N1/adenine58-N1)-methyltransferase